MSHRPLTNTSSLKIAAAYSPARTNFTLMMERTPVSSRYYYVYSVHYIMMKKSARPPLYYIFHHVQSCRVRSPYYTVVCLFRYTKKYKDLCAAKGRVGRPKPTSFEEKIAVTDHFLLIIEYFPRAARFPTNFITLPTTLKTAIYQKAQKRPSSPPPLTTVYPGGKYV
jgi:hypothetical protein